MSAWLWPVQKAIYDQIVNECTYPVYDDVPQNTDYPYITIGDDTSTEWDTVDKVGGESTLTVHTWSREAGRREIKKIMSEVYEVLHMHELDVPGYNVVLCRQEFAESLPVEADGRTRHGVQRFRVIIHDE